MTRKQTVEYYEMINAKDRLIDIDATDSVETIEEKLQAVSRFSGTCHIEVFSNDNNIQSYSMLELGEQNENGEPLFNLWEQKTSKMNNADRLGIAKYIYDNMPKTANIPLKFYVADNYGDHGLIVGDLEHPEVGTKAIKFPETEEEASRILGCIVTTDENGKKVIEAHPVNHADLSEFDNIIKHIENERIKLFVKYYMRIIPDYVFTVPVTGSLDDKNASDASEGGLKRRMINMANLLISLTSLDFYQIRFTRAEIDKMIVACLFHAFLKSGWQDEYEYDSFAKPNYPKREAEVIKSMTGILEKNDLIFIANLVESHKGQWNDNGALPIPDTDCKFLVHMVYFIASNENLVFVTNNELYAFKSQKVNVIEQTIDIEDTDVAILQNCLDQDIDMNRAKELNIHRDEQGIKKVWLEIIKNHAHTPQQQKYMRLAESMRFL